MRLFSFPDIPGTILKQRLSGTSQIDEIAACRRGSRGGEMGEFSPTLFLSPLLSFFPYPSNIEIIFDFSDIITKIHPPFQNPGSAPGLIVQ